MESLNNNNTLPRAVCCDCGHHPENNLVECRAQRLNTPPIHKIRKHHHHRRHSDNDATTPATADSAISCLINHADVERQLSKPPSTSAAVTSTMTISHAHNHVLFIYARVARGLCNASLVRDRCSMCLCLHCPNDLSNDGFLSRRENLPARRDTGADGGDERETRAVRAVHRGSHVRARGIKCNK